MNETDHVSEALRPYAEGGVDEATERRVERHLRECDECRAELAGVRALLGAPPEGLTEIERARVRRGIADATGADAPSRRRRALYAALGAAALVVIVAVGAFYTLGTGERGGAGGSVAVSEDRAEEAQGGGQPLTARAFGGPVFEEDAGELDDAALRRTGSRGPVAAVARSVSPERAEEVADDYLESLVDAAPDPVRDQVQTCADTILEANEDFTLVPAYGATGTVADRDALVLGFAWSNEERGSLTGYMVYAWPTPAGCDIPLSYQAGEIPRR